MTIIHESEDRLSRVCWDFYLHGRGEGITVRLVCYREQTRPSTKHRKWINVSGKCWSASNNREYWNGFGRSLETVPLLPMADIEAQILSSVIYLEGVK